MNYIAKKQEQNEVVSEYYELFTTETINDIEGNEVIIPRPLGHYSISQLEGEKKNLETAIAEINKKMEAINNLK